MRIRSVSMQDFLSHKDTKLVFPDRGMIVVSGPNGAGKSSLLEAVGVGFWGKPLRGRGRLGARSLNLWATPKGRIEIETDALRAVRTAKGKVTWWLGAKKATKFENNKKAQEALETVIGSQANWAKRFIFSSEAALFTAGTDADRTRLIEAILGLDGFDSASDRAREDLRGMLVKQSTRQHSLDLQEERAKFLRQRLAELSDLPQKARVGVKLLKPSTVDDFVTQLECQVAGVPSRDELREAARSKAFLEAKLSSARAASSTGTCPTCGQEINGKNSEHKPADVKAIKVKLRKARQCEEDLRASHLEAEKASAEARELLAEAKDWRRRWEEAYQHRVKLLEELEDLEDEIDSSKVKLDAMTEVLEEQKAAVKVLSVGGVRAHLLEDALAGIESIANSWLQMFSNAGDYQLQVKLKPYTEKKTGGSRPAISIQVDGVANGQGYLAASNGERRRVDIALLLALPEVSTSGDLGVLFFDEVFDALDDEGRDAVCEILKEISKRCCVVLITHSQALRARIAPMADAMWRVEGGKVHV